MILTDQQEHSLRTESLLGGWQAPIEYFAFASGAPFEHGEVRSWIVQYIELNLQVLKAKLLERFPTHHYADDALALIEISGRLPDGISEIVLTSPHFIRWLNQSFLDLTNTEIDEDVQADRFFRQVLSLPILVARYFSQLGITFDTPVLIPPRVLPVGCDWELNCDEALWGSASLSDHQFSFSSPSGGFQLRVNSDGHLLELRQPSVGEEGSRFQVTPRHFLSRTRTELNDHRLFPFDHFDLTTCSLFQGEPAIISSLNRSIDILEQAWPEAVNHLADYARVIVPYVPHQSGRHDSCTIRRYLFAQGTDIIPGDELQNLASIIHESMHSKLHVLLSGKVLYWNRNDDFEFAHPWMEIKRPLRGVFLGAHAFINILSLYFRVREHVPELKASADFYFRNLAPQVNLAIEEMVRGDLTEEGERFYVALRQHYDELTTHAR